MNNHQIELASLEHAEQLAPRLRKGDLAEIAAATGGTPEEALLLSLAMTPNAKTWLYKGRVMAIFGIAPDPTRPGVGIPWLLAGRGADKHKIFFVRNSRRLIDEAAEGFAYLENFVDCRNTVSIQWLSWCGFALAEVIPFFGVQRLPFIRFCRAGTPPR